MFCRLDQNDRKILAFCIFEHTRPKMILLIENNCEIFEQIFPNSYIWQNSWTKN